MLFDNFSVLMDESGMDGGGGVAVETTDFDSPSSESAEVHDAEFVDAPAEGGQEQEQVEESTAVVKAGERALSDGKFTQSGKSAIQAVRVLSPRLAQEVTSALLTTDWLRREFPGGKKEIQSLRKLAQDSGGEQGFGELRSVLQQYDQLDDLYLSKNPQFLEQITESPEGKDAYIALMPEALKKFRTMAPQQFAFENAKNFAHLMDEARLPVAFARMADLLTRASQLAQSGNHEMASSLVREMASAHNEIAGVLDGVYAAAKNPPPAPQKDPAVDEQAKALRQREQALQRQEWQTAVGGERRRVFAKAWSEMTKGRNLTSDQDQNIKGFYELRLSAKIRQWQNQSERFFANGDKDGYLREQFGFFQKAIPEALRQAIQQALPAKPGPKTATQPGKAAPARTQSRGTAPAGTVRVAKMPPTSQLDLVKTTSAMVSQNQAYGRDGKIYQWA